MSIVYDEGKKQFHLYNQNISYVMEIVEEKYLIQVYYGKRVNSFNQVGAYPRQDRSSFSPNPYDLSNKGFSLDAVLQEAPGYDNGDYREGIVEALYADGTKATNFTFLDFEIIHGKEQLKGLPATYVTEEEEADTLKIRLQDPYRKLLIVMSYSIYKERNVITKSIVYSNQSETQIILNKALSACLDLPDSDYDLIQFPGAWAREKQMKRDSLSAGIHYLDSKRGASSVTQQPFVALVDPTTTEHSGVAMGFHFVYSGNFEITAEVDPFEQTRILMGINSFNFDWVLAPSESFQTPEVVMVYSDQGLNDMSHTYHRLYIERLARGKHQFSERPVLINNWETTYFDFTEEKLINLADQAQKIGVELFVLDDGWFGKRNTDTTSLGDWMVNQEKLPDGLKSLAEKIHQKGLKFGLWFEPEMISEESELYKKHPDWHLHIENYPTSLGRNQLILDFSRKEVREYIYKQLTAILDEVPIDYIKWDMNRNMSEVGSKGRKAEEQMMTSHKYILGLYDVLERLTTRYPDILFENCSGGAGRFDAGMTYYMPQSWTSDNTDAIERLKIQYSTSFMFPPVMMCSQLSEAPNHQVGRITDLTVRSAIAASGNFGLMMDLEKKTPEELEALKKVIKNYKSQRKLIQFGEFSRLVDPYQENSGAWQFLDHERNHGIICFVEILSHASKPWKKVKLVGLDAEAFYKIEEKVISGSELMNYGLFLNDKLFGDFQAKVIEFQKVK